MSVKTDREKYNDACWRQGEPRREANRQRLLATGTPTPERITAALDYRMLEGPQVDIECGGPLAYWLRRVVPTPEAVTT